MKTLKPGLRSLLGLVLAAPLLLASGRVEAHGFEGLRPGKFVVRDQAVPVRLVFIGYERTEIE